jgi:hypothetical protein
MTVDLDGRGKNVMGTNTFDFVYGGNAFGSTPTVTAMFKKDDDKDEKTNEGVTEKENEGVDLNLSDSFEIPPEPPPPPRPSRPTASPSAPPTPGTNR